MDADAEFLKRLQEFTRGSDTWDNFDPTKWRDIASEEISDNEAALASNPVPAISTLALTPFRDFQKSAPMDVDSDSDGGPAIIFGHHHLTAEEISRNRGYKLSKARDFASDEPEVLRDVAKLQKVTWRETGLKMGDVSIEGDVFSPWRLVRAYPEMYVGKRNSVRAAPLFAADAIHEDRVWDFYYIHQRPGSNRKPALFVPTYQFKHFLEVVNAKLETELTIPNGTNYQKFTMSFGLGNMPKPRFLGRSTSRQGFEVLCKAIETTEKGDDLKNTTKVGQEEFLRLLSVANSTNKKEPVKSDKNKRKRVQNHVSWGKEIKRIQRYLGLRQRVGGKNGVVSDVPTALDLHRPTVLEPEGSVLFIAIDIEAYEFNHNIITEIGLAMLDTKDLANTAPGDGGKGWFPLIRARHLRIKENSWAMNTTHVHGCADNFDFGTSEFVPKHAAIAVLNHIIQQEASASGDGPEQQRPVVLVFHEALSDIKFLQSMNCNIYKTKNAIDIADTREMYQYMCRAKNPTKLESILEALDIPYRYLHNAGNDAVYTLRAMVGLAIKRRLASLEKAAKLKNQAHNVIPYAEFVDKDKDGFSSHGEGSDGGEPLNPVNRDPRPDVEEKQGDQASEVNSKSIDW
ncbi:hypothetical protein B0T24DRAFT_675173 [Lasiosphaeria ovina]|uniref:Gfd2/YDR514C-like C-terminal domain-containing protein n=1 Tax=Lasiosphaeria ovina TaxID=92902 RepID=A0AAE0KN83_9PEZI|nr:hypothetical protein B0T24DRAFT_675173 [Lasiosphaeria ovina]